MSLFVSIITVSYNSSKTIKETIESVLNQSCQNFEYILVDGNSTDGTVEIIKSYEQKFKEKGIAFKWKSEDDTGIYDAWNKGVKMAEGTWIAFLGSDDVYELDAIQCYYDYIDQNNEELNYVSSKVKIINNKLIDKIEHKWEWNVFKKQMIIGHVGSFHHQSYFKEYGLFDTSYKIAGDYELLLRAKNNLKAGFLPKYTVVMNGDGVSLDNVNKALSEAYRARVTTGARLKYLAYIDFLIIHLKIKIKTLIKGK